MYNKILQHQGCFLPFRTLITQKYVLKQDSHSRFEVLTVVAKTLLSSDM